MAPKFVDRLSHAWDAFTANEKLERRDPFISRGSSFGIRPDRFRPSLASDRSIVSSIYTRIAVDCASVDMKHVRIDQNGRYQHTMSSGLNSCLTLEANLDQAARAFRIDFFLTLFDKGVAAIVPIETDIDPSVSTSYDILSMRVGTIVDWMPEHVRVRVYNVRKGIHEELVMSKRQVAIVENPLYNTMNEPNSTLQRLIRKLSLIDSVDEAAGAGKLDIIIQLPYTIKTESRKNTAETRRRDMEEQLTGSKYGVAYTDATEKITQLNRPAENNMLKQVEFLTGMLYGQLGITEGVMNGTASEAEMVNYYIRTTEPLLTALTQELKRKFLTKTGRTQGQSVEFYRDPLKLIPISQFGTLADTLSRNEIITANEIRNVIGLMPSEDPKADQLINTNMPQPVGEPLPVTDSFPGSANNPVEGFFKPVPLPGAEGSTSENPFNPVPLP